jgi:tetratricopeptide (TPR) repeat protein
MILTMAAILLHSAALQDDSELGQKAYREGRFAESADRFEKAVLKDQKSPILWVALGHASLQAGRWDAAVRAYREAIALKAETADLDRALARALDQGGRTDEAIASLRRAASLDPAGSDSLSISRLFVRREEWMLAEQEILLYLRTTPASTEGLETLAFILGRSGRAVQAGEVYRDLERRVPHETKYRLARARLAASQSRYGEAIDSLETVRYLGGLKEEDERLLADLYLQEKMFAEAAACYARRLAISASPKADDAYRLGHAFYESKQLASAKEAFLKVLAIDPAHGGATLYLGHIAVAQGNADEARKDFGEAEARMADSPQPALALGNLELRESSWEKAAAAFREALKRGSSDPSVWYDLVFSWIKAGRKPEALQALKEALRQAPLDERLRGLLHELEK